MTEYADPMNTCPKCGQWRNPDYTHTCPEPDKAKPANQWYVRDDNELLIEILDTLKDIKTLLEGLNESKILTGQGRIEEFECDYDDDDEDKGLAGTS